MFSQLHKKNPHILKDKCCHNISLDRDGPIWQRWGGSSYSSRALGGAYSELPTLPNMSFAVATLFICSVPVAPATHCLCTFLKYAWAIISTHTHVNPFPFIFNTWHNYRLSLLQFHPVGFLDDSRYWWWLTHIPLTPSAKAEVLLLQTFSTLYLRSFISHRSPLALKWSRQEVSGS